MSITIDRDRLIKALNLDSELREIISRLDKLVNALRSVSADKVLTVISEDDVGVARESTLQDILNTVAKDVTLQDVKSILLSIIEQAARNLILTKLADAEIALAVDLQYRYKAGFTVFSGTVTASGNTAEIVAEQFSALEVLVKVTSVGGTSPTLSVYIEGKFETTGDWKTLASQENITTTGTWFLTINPLIFRVIRARWVVGGTSPSFAVTIAAQGMA